MLVLNETLAEGADHRNGTDMFERAKGKIFRGTVVDSELNVVVLRFQSFVLLCPKPDTNWGKSHHKLVMPINI